MADPDCAFRHCPLVPGPLAAPRRHRSTVAEFYLSLGAETADILGDFNLAMAHGVESGELDNIYYRYLGFSRNGYARYIEHSDGAGTAENNSIEQ